MFDQTIQLAPRVTSYTVVCAECALEHGVFGAQVEGRLALERVHSAVTCTRGHQIRVERVKRGSASAPPLGWASTRSGRIALVPATVIVGAQWGDEGKGKIVDLLAQDSDLVCRYQGGPNAGHTVIVAGETFKFRHLPSGILSGKVSVLGAGCVVDPGVLVDELDGLEGRGVSSEPLRISGNAHLIMPWHIAIDGAGERRLGKLQIGTTRRGIGPAYADKALRLGIRVQDLLDPKILRQKIETALAEKNVWLERVYEHEPFELEEVAKRHEELAQRLRPYVTDTSLLVDTALRDGKRVLLEGAQGTLLDLDHGTYPFVTSSNPIAGAAATGIGIGPTRIDEVVGVSKAYVTRVGRGPFPSEMEDELAAKVRELGQEFGTVTGRERRPGWLDLVGAPLRGAAERDHLARTDEARRALGLRRAARVRPLPPSGRDRDAGLPGAPERLPPRRGRARDRPGLGRAAGLVHDDRRPAGGRPRLRPAGRAGARRAGAARRHRRRPRADPGAARPGLRTRFRMSLGSQSGPAPPTKPVCTEL